MGKTPMPNHSTFRSVAAGLLAAWLLFGMPAGSMLAQLPVKRPAAAGNLAATPAPNPVSKPGPNSALPVPVATPVATPGATTGISQPPTAASLATGVPAPGGMTPSPAATAVPMDPQAQRRARIKDVASIEGIRDNQLVGYGVVVGLRGTGDTQQTIFPMQSLLSILLRMGVNVPQTGTLSAQNMQVKNMAAVFIEATLPPFSHTGERIDVTISSAGDARSLEGGVLLLSPLYGPDGQIYAQAEGPLVIGGYRVSAGFNTTQVNYPTTARIPGGALV